jgi:hypothetical protein
VKRAYVLRRLSFLQVIWFAAALMMVYVVLGPILEGLWARYAWDRVPCAIIRDGTTFLFVHDNVRYYSTRLDFWNRDRTETVAAAVDTDLPKFDQTCYVKPNDPRYAVLDVNAYNHLDHGFHGVTTAAVLGAATVILTIVVKKKQAERTAAHESKLPGQ